MRFIFKFLQRLVNNLNPRHSLRARLGLAIGCIALVLSIITSLVVGHTASNQLKVYVGQALAELAFQMTDKLDRGMFERYRDIQIISTLNTFRDPNASVSEQRTLLEKLQSTYPDYAWIGLTDGSGIVQASTGKLLEGRNLSQRPWFIHGKKSPYVGDVHEALKLAKLLPNPTNEPLRFVDVAVPVIDFQGNLRGVLGAHLSWRWSREVEKSLLHSSQARSIELFVLNEQGDPLLVPSGFNSSSSVKALPAKALSLMSVKKAQQGVNSYLIETWPDGHTYLIGFAHSSGYRDYPGLGWLVLVRQRTDVAFAPATKLEQQILLWDVILGGIITVLGWFVADCIVKPMLAIAAAADRIRQGNIMVKIPLMGGRDETAKLSRSLNRLVSTLTQQENNLKASNEQLQLELSERQRVEEFLRSSEEKFRQLAENIQEVFWIYDLALNEIIYVSPAYEQVWGCSCESLYANPQSWLDIIHEEDRERVITNLADNATKAFEIEYRIVKPNREVRWIWDQSFPIHNVKGEVYRRTGLSQDITERKQAEETRKSLEKERELSELQSSFIRMISHEYRTPLTKILTSAELLQNYSHKLTEEKKLVHLQRIQSSVQHMTNLVNDVLVINQAEAGKLQFNPVPLQLDKFCQELVEELQSHTDSKHQLRFRNQGECSETYLDEKLLRQILTNLLSNAIKYSPEGSEVNFELTCDQEVARFCIQDQGIGIPPAEQAQLFKSFYRASNVGTISGTGLGLAIVKKAVELHEGQITFESTVGLGTTFTVILPLCRQILMNEEAADIKSSE